LEPIRYYDPFEEDANQRSNAYDLNKEVLFILREKEELLIYCLFREHVDNPYRQKFKKNSIRFAILLATALIVMACAALGFPFGRGSIWLAYSGFLILVVSSCVSFACRSVLKKYVRFNLLKGKEWRRHSVHG
jgi:hypothetical protein